MQPAQTIPLRHLPPAQGRPQPPARLASHGLLTSSVGFLVLLVLMPVLVLGGIALTGGFENWRHLAENVLPQSLGTTLLLLSLVAVGTASIGVTTAWLIVSHDFPMRRLLAWALKEIAASNRRFNDFVAEIARINKVLSLAHDDTAHHRPLPDVSALEDERRPPPRVL